MSKNDQKVAFMKIKEAKALKVGAADLTNNLSQSALNTLIESISKLGIQQPIELFDGKLHDGRHRIKVAGILGIEDIPYITLNIDAMEHLVKHEAGRHLGPQQKAIFAVKLVETYGIKPGEAQRKTGASANYYRVAKRIATLDRGVLDAIYDGKAYYDVNGQFVGSLVAIEKDMRLRINNPFTQATSQTPIDDWLVAELTDGKVKQLAEMLTYIDDTAEGWLIYREIGRLAYDQIEEIKIRAQELKG